LAAELPPQGMFCMGISTMQYHATLAEIFWKKKAASRAAQKPPVHHR